MSGSDWALKFRFFVFETLVLRLLRNTKRVAF